MKNIDYIIADIITWHDILIAHLTSAMIVGLATYLRPLSCASHCNPSGKTNKDEVCMFININHIT
jgi:hypothetical protein